MSVKVQIREGESLRSALQRLRTKIRHAYRRQWFRSRPGAFEKPSDRRRKRESLRNRNARLAARQTFRQAEERCTVSLDLRRLFSREEAYQRKRQPFHPPRKWWKTRE